MTPEQFCYWLQGTFEINNSKTFDEPQVQIIKDHLNTVFNKITPPVWLKADMLKEIQKRIDGSKELEEFKKIHPCTKHIIEADAIPADAVVCKSQTYC